MTGFFALLTLSFVYNLAHDFSNLPKHKKLYWTFGVLAFLVLLAQYGK